ncbi:MAG: hypothetical protein ACK4VM_04425, partial [Bosea sp. (in: a-proteobacteria)]
MRLNINAELTYGFGSPTQIIAAIEAARSPDQTIISENLMISPDAELVLAEGEDGERRFRAVLSGEAAISYAATVDNH